jgi:Spy/CpxP family protein refolding chaperone
MKKLCLIIIVLLAPVAVNSMAFEAPFPSPGNCPPMKLFKDLNLTAEQASRLHELKLEFLKTSKPVMDKLMAKRGDLDLFWLEKNPEAGKIAAVQKEIMGLENSMIEMELKHRFAVLKMLTPDQQEILRLHFSHHPAFSPPPPGRECLPPIPFAPPCHGVF